MSTAMEQFLDDLIDHAPNETVEAQIIFKPGTGASAGGLRRAKDRAGIALPGMYELCTFTAPSHIAPQNVREHDLVAVSMFFEADAVQRVMRPTEEGKVELRKQPLIVPVRS